MGMNNIVPVDCDPVTGVMIPEKLDEAITKEKEKGRKPFFVNAVSGTTVLGSFDDLETISKICKKHDVWLHVDACWGSFLIFCETGKKLFKGVENVDSIALNAHKGMFVPLQCSYLITNNHPKALAQTCCTGADYLFMDSEVA